MIIIEHNCSDYKFTKSYFFLPFKNFSSFYFIILLHFRLTSVIVESKFSTEMCKNVEFMSNEWISWAWEWEDSRGSERTLKPPTQTHTTSAMSVNVYQNFPFILIRTFIFNSQVIQYLLYLHFSTFNLFQILISTSIGYFKPKKYFWKRKN